jgi:hypothetical protein
MFRWVCTKLHDVTSKQKIIATIVTTFNLRHKISTPHALILSAVWNYTLPVIHAHSESCTQQPQCHVHVKPSRGHYPSCYVTFHVNGALKSTHVLPQVPSSQYAGRRDTKPRSQMSLRRYQPLGQCQHVWQFNPANHSGNYMYHLL